MLPHNIHKSSDPYFASFSQLFLAVGNMYTVDRTTCFLLGSRAVASCAWYDCGHSCVGGRAIFLNDFGTCFVGGTFVWVSYSRNFCDKDNGKLISNFCALRFEENTRSLVIGLESSGFCERLCGDGGCDVWHSYVKDDA